MLIDFRTLGAAELYAFNHKRSPASKYDVTVVLFPVDAVAVRPSLFWPVVSLKNFEFMIANHDAFSMEFALNLVIHESVQMPVMGILITAMPWSATKRSSTTLVQPASS